MIAFCTFIPAYVQRYGENDVAYWLLFILFFIIDTVGCVMNAYNNITWVSGLLCPQSWAPLLITPYRKPTACGLRTAYPVCRALTLLSSVSSLYHTTKRRSVFRRIRRRAMDSAIALFIANSTFFGDLASGERQD